MAQSAISHAIENEAGVLDRACSLELLVETIEALAATTSVEEIAAIIRTNARRLSGAEGVTFVLRDLDRCHYLDEDAIAPLWKGMKFPLTACISGWTMLNNQTAVIPDIYQDDRIPHDAYRPTFVKSMVMTPVGKDQPRAAIGAYWSVERQPTQDEIDGLRAMARATATALENIRLMASLTESLERRDFLIRELDHRVKNMLASVQAIARQTLKTAPTQERFVDSFNGRLMALSRAHVLLTQEAWKHASLSTVASEALSPFKAVADRVQVSGPPVMLGPVQAVAAHLAFHELVTNAMAHGALSTPDGDVALVWNIEMADGGERRLVLAWRERGGPRVRPPARPGVGMGMRLIQQGLPHALDGVCRVDFDPSGLRIEVIAPLSSTVQLA